jgi:hypothetical protein
MKLAIILFLAASASAHRLDEYLQATIISVEKDRVQAEMRLVPGIAISSFVLNGIDTNRDGVISPEEQQSYAERVLQDLSLSMDGYILKPQLTSAQFPGVEEMREGLGEIHIGFSADLPRGGPNRRLIFENRHHRAIAAYLVNCLVPRDRDISVVAQNRNQLQSFYQLDYLQAGVSLNGWLGIIALFLIARFAVLWRQARPVRPTLPF